MPGSLVVTSKSYRHPDAYDHANKHNQAGHSEQVVPNERPRGHEAAQHNVERRATVIHQGVLPNMLTALLQILSKPKVR